MRGLTPSQMLDVWDGCAALDDAGRQRLILRIATDRPAEEIEALSPEDARGLLLRVRAATFGHTLNLCCNCTICGALLEAAVDCGGGEAVPPASFQVNCEECGGSSTCAFDAGDYFHRELVSAARALLVEISDLAHAYGWSEGEILALPPSRRRRYLALLESGAQDFPDADGFQNNAARGERNSALRQEFSRTAALARSADRSSATQAEHGTAVVEHTGSAVTENTFLLGTDGDGRSSRLSPAAPIGAPVSPRLPPAWRSSSAVDRHVPAATAAAMNAGPAVHVSIGRIDVKAVTQRSPHAREADRARRRTPAMDLSEYLARRESEPR